MIFYKFIYPDILMVCIAAVQMLIQILDLATYRSNINEGNHMRCCKDEWLSIQASNLRTSCNKPPNAK